LAHGRVKEQALRKRQAGKGFTTETRRRGVWRYFKENQAGTSRPRRLRNGKEFDKGTAHMPTYEYECAKCGKTFDLYQSMKDDPIKICPNKKCKGKVKRLIGTGAGLIFKGSGFYITDYRSEGYKQAAKKDSGASGGGEATKPAGSEKSKPAETPKPAKPSKE